VGAGDRKVWARLRR
jgi:HTH-like domain